MTAAPNLRAALAAAQAEVHGLVFKAGANAEQRYRYVGHEDVIEHVRGAMMRHGLVIIPQELRFVSELRWTSGKGDRTVWLWEATLLVMHTESEEGKTMIVQVTTIPNDKAAFVASTAADRTALMRLMRLAGTSDENPEHESHGREERPQQGQGRPQARPAGNAGAVVQTLISECVALKPDRENLSNFYEHATAELTLCHANEQQRLAVKEAFGKACASVGLKPRDVVEGRPS